MQCGKKTHFVLAHFRFAEYLRCVGMSYDVLRCLSLENDVILIDNDRR